MTRPARRHAAALAAASLAIVLTGCEGQATSTPTVTVTQRVTAAASPSPSLTPSPSDPLPRKLGRQVHMIADDRSWQLTSTVTRIGSFTDPIDGAMTGIWAKTCVDSAPTDGIPQGLGWYDWTLISADGTQTNGHNAEDQADGQQLYPLAQTVPPKEGECFE